MTLTKRIEFSPAYDGVDMAFYVTGELGVVQFKVSTGWMLPHVRDQHRGQHRVCELYPMPIDLGYHSRTPHYEDQSIMREDCPLLDAPCYYNGSGLNAEPIFEVLVSQGHDAVWERLESYYNDTFGTTDAY